MRRSGDYIVDYANNHGLSVIEIHSTLNTPEGRQAYLDEMHEKCDAKHKEYKKARDLAALHVRFRLVR